MVLSDLLSTVIAADGIGYSVLKVVAVMALTYLIARLFDDLLEDHFRRVSRRVAMRKTSYMLLRRLITLTIYLIGFGAAIYIVPQLRQLSLALFASAGFIGIVLGLAAQSALSNVISGVFLVLFQPFRIGDMIETQEHYGWIEDITLRHTVIQTPANERVVIPNAQISDDYIINYSLRETKCRFDVDVGIAYDEDINKARQIMLEEADKHELTYNEESEVIVKELGDSSVVLQLRIWGTDRMEAWRAGQDIREAIKNRFDEEDITIPFPQRTVSYLNDKDSARTDM